MGGRLLYHRTLLKNVESIMKDGLIPSGAFVSLSEKPDSWYTDLPLLSVDIDSFRRDFPDVRVTTWLPELDEVCVWGTIPAKYIRYIAKVDCGQTDDMNKVSRPWGWYSATSEDKGFKTKILCVNPRHRLSLQSHAHRKELWSVISGEGTCTVGDRTVRVSADSFVLVPRGEKHRIENTSDDTLLLISEVQVGDVLSEDDIVRYEDDYGR